MMHAWEVPWRPRWFSSMVDTTLPIDMHGTSRGPLMWIDDMLTLQFSSRNVVR